MFDTEEVEVGVRPADPGADGGSNGVEPDDEARQRDRQKDFGRCESHEAEVTSGSKGFVRRQELTELDTASDERSEREDTVYSRY